MFNLGLLHADMSIATTAGRWLTFTCGCTGYAQQTIRGVWGLHGLDLCCYRHEPARAPIRMVIPNEPYRTWCEGGMR